MQRDDHSDRVSVPMGTFLAQIKQWTQPDVAERLRAAGYNVPQVLWEDLNNHAAQGYKIEDWLTFWEDLADRLAIPIVEQDKLPIDRIFRCALARAGGVRDEERMRDDERARTEQRRRVQVEEQAPAETQEPPASQSVPETGGAEPLGPRNEPKHSEDFMSVNWFGESFTFTAMQAACIKVLWEAWENGTPTIGEQTILEQAGSCGNRLDQVFRTKNKPHTAWGTMVQKEGKGRFRLGSIKKTGTTGKPQ